MTPRQVSSDETGHNLRARIGWGRSLYSFKARWGVATYCGPCAESRMIPESDILRGPNPARYCEGCGAVGYVPTAKELGIEHDGDTQGIVVGIQVPSPVA